jgi:hypothetical protein
MVFFSSLIPSQIFFSHSASKALAVDIESLFPIVFAGRFTEPWIVISFSEWITEKFTDDLFLAVIPQVEGFLFCIGVEAVMEVES